MRFQYTILYIVLIVAVNYGFTVTPLVALPGGEKWPPLSLIVGFIFVARDFAQREIGHRVIIAMLLAGGLSYVMADPFVAAASLAAFLISEFADWAVYSFTGRPFAQRVLLSSALGTPLDSVIFLAMIGHLSVTGVVAMTASKMLGALVVWWMLRRRDTPPTAQTT
ncbi:MAG: VUT family protein [Alphaproteobacteria bacterium]|jgi:queuosine precursor transporter|nr:VUT family protein [Alphaproteobacteria bacterium]